MLAILTTQSFRTIIASYLPEDENLRGLDCPFAGSLFLDLSVEHAARSANADLNIYSLLLCSGV